METMQIPADNRSECESDHLSAMTMCAMTSSCNVAMEVGSASSGRVSLSRRLPAVCSGYRHHASTSRRGSRHGSAFLLLRLGPLHRAGLGHGLNRLWLAALRGGGGFLAVEFGEAPALHLRIQHFQGSTAGVDLIVMREIGEAFENAEQLLVP
jgi:hypothetical protein